MTKSIPFHGCGYEWWVRSEGADAGLVKLYPLVCNIIIIEVVCTGRVSSQAHVTQLGFLSLSSVPSLISTTFVAFGPWWCVIHAFYIIIYTTHIIILECYWHCYIIVFACFRWLWDFHTKSLFLVFNLWEAENLLFLVFNVSRATVTQMEKGKLHSWFFIERITEERRSKGEEPQGPKEGAHTKRFLGRVGPTKWSLGHFLARGFLTRLRLARKVTP